MKKYKIEEIEGRRIVVNCKTQQEADAFFESCYSAGYTHLKEDVGWVPDISWSHFKDQTCYRLDREVKIVNRGLIRFYSRKNFTVIFEDQVI